MRPIEVVVGIIGGVIFLGLWRITTRLYAIHQTLKQIEFHARRIPIVSTD